MNIVKVIKYTLCLVLLGTFLFFSLNGVNKLLKRLIGAVSDSKEMPEFFYPSFTLCHLDSLPGHGTNSKETFAEEYENLKMSMKQTLVRVVIGSGGSDLV